MMPLLYTSFGMLRHDAIALHKFHFEAPFAVQRKSIRPLRWTMSHSPCVPGPIHGQHRTGFRTVITFDTTGSHSGRIPCRRSYIPFLLFW
jgi:hypothetical protein